jgi:hypothetical protein
MKKYLWVTVFCTCTISHFCSHAQFDHELLGGLNLSNIRSQTTLEHEPATGIHVGWSGQIHFKKRITLVSGIVFTEKGFIKNHVRRLFSYVALPVMIRYSVLKRLSVEAGAGIGYLLHVKTKYDSKWGPAPDEITRDIWQQRLDFQVAGGVRYELFERFGLTLRYEYGLSNLVGDAEVRYRVIGAEDPLLHQDPITYRDLGIKDLNRNIQLSLSYSLKGKRGQ